MIKMEKFLRRREGNETSGVKKSDAGSEDKSFANVVGDKDDGLLEAKRQSGELALKFGASDGIERAEGFVHQEDGRVCSEGARDADALTLAAGKLTRAS